MEIHYKTKIAKAQDIYKHLMECKENFHPPLDTSVNIQEYAKKLFNNSVTFEAWDKLRLVGLVATYFNDTKNHLGFISNVSVSTTYSGKRIASTLMNNCINYAAKHHIKEINLEVNKNSTNAIHLYEKFNFKKTGNKENFVIMRHKPLYPIHKTD